MIASTLQPPAGSPIASSPLFADVAAWRRATRHYHIGSDRAASRAMKAKNKREQARHWRAYELNIMRCPSPEATIAKCGHHGCTLPKGHGERMAHDIPSANTGMSERSSIPADANVRPS